MGDMTDQILEQGGWNEWLAFKPRRWNPPDVRGMTFTHLMNARRYWSRNSAPQAADYVRRLQAELNRRSESADTGSE